MAFDVSVILPNNLRSGYLQSEFVASGIAYTTNKYSKDPNLDNNRNQLKLGFQLRDKNTRLLVDLVRVNALYISNDPYFEPSSTVRINNWPPKPEEFNSDYNYIYDINASYFFDNSLSQGSFGGTAAGTGLFIINNWALSANGGLSRVYLKAVVEGPSTQLVEYPNGYGIFDTIVWEGEIPTSPASPEFSSLKTGYIGENTIVNFKPSSSSTSQVSNSGISHYLGSLYEVTSTGNTLDLYSAKGSAVKRTISPSASTASTTVTSYSYARNSTISSYEAYSYSLDTNINLVCSSTGASGVAFYSDSKVPYSSSKPDIITQAAFGYTASGIAITSSVTLKIYDQPATSAGSKEIALRVDIPGNSYPTAYFYTIDGGVESAAKQTTTLPNSLLPLFKNGGLLELYYSNVDSTYAQVEGYFTPYEDQSQASKKSYLLAHALVTSFGSTVLGGAFSYHNDGPSTSTSTVKLSELVITQAKNKLSFDLGNASKEDLNNIGYPLVSITDTWAEDLNNEYIALTDLPSGSSISASIGSTYYQINKIDSSDSYQVPGLYELQLFRPSLSNACSLTVDVLHKTDDFYVAFSPVSSYRPHTVNNLQVEWDRPLGSRLLEENAYATSPISAATIVVKFSKDKKNISLLQRNSDGTYNKHTFRSYTPSSTNDKYLIQIQDQVPTNIKGTKKSTSANSTWCLVKKINGQKIDLIGQVQLAKKLNVSDDGLGYYSACGFIKSSYDGSSTTNYNKIYEVKFESLPSLYGKQNDSYDSIKSAVLSPQGLSVDKHYLGIDLLSSATDFVGFNYKNPISSSIAATVSAASDGINYTVSSLPTATVDGISLAGLGVSSYVILKDQLETSENGLYIKTANNSFTKITAQSNKPYEVNGGTVNNNITFYSNQIEQDNQIFDTFTSTAYFKQITIDTISPFVNSIRPSLLEIKMNVLDYENQFDLSKLKVRFYTNTNDLPDSSSPLTDWLSIDYNPFISGFLPASGNNLLQIKLSNSSNQSPLVSSSDKIWMLVSAPFNCSLAEAYGPQYQNRTYITSGKFNNYQLADNLWHKLYARDYEKSKNVSHKSQQHFRLRALSHAKVSSFATNLSSASVVDIEGPTYNGSFPKIENGALNITRLIEMSILAEDTVSGIMAFRVGRDIDNFRTQYTPWMSWNEFVVSETGKYTIYLYGNLNYYDNGAVDSVIDIQNIGFSGPRKIWVQLLDYAGNVSESYPLTFVAQTWGLVDTMPPVGYASFYNPKTNSTTEITNLTKAVVKLDATDVVSGVKDFKYRFVKDSGPDAWSDWEPYSTFKSIDFTNENDGVKKVEFVFRDYGNNAIQPEEKWEKVVRPNK